MRRPTLLLLAALLLAGCPSEPPVTQPAPKRSPTTSGASTDPSAGPSTAASASARPGASASPGTATSASPSASASATPTPTPVSPLVVGLRNGGDGLPANRVTLDQVWDLAVETDGALLVSHLGRLNRITQDGLLKKLSAAPFDTPATLDGVALSEASLRLPHARQKESAGRWLVTEPQRLLRVELDGKLTELWPQESGSGVAGCAPMTNGDVLVLIRRGQASDPTYDIWTVKPDKTRTKLHTFTGDDETVLDGLVSPGLLPTQPHDVVVADGQGGMLLWIGAGKSGSALYRFDPTAKTLKRQGDGPANAIALDGAGNFYLHTAGTAKLEVRKPDGTVSTLTEKLPAGFQPFVAALAADGTAYVIDRPVNANDPQLLLKVKAGEVTTVSGPVDTLPTNLDEVSLDPYGLAVTASGTVYVGDIGQKRVLKVVPGQGVTRFGGLATGPAPTDGAKADAVALDPGAMRVDQAGNLYLINRTATGSQVLKATADGTLKVLHSVSHTANATELDRLVDLAVTPEGQVTVLTHHLKDGVIQSSALSRLEASAQSLPTPVKVVTAIAFTPDGALAMVGYDTTSPTEPTSFTMATWTAAKGITKLQTFTRVQPATAGTGLAIAPGGTFILAGGPNRGTIFAVDPVNGTVQTLVGEGGAHFLGKTHDDGVRGPAFPAFDAAGNLYFADTYQKQVKAVAADAL